VSVLQRLADVPGVLVMLFAGVAWYMAVERIAGRLGAHEAAPAVGAIAGLAVAVWLYRRATVERVESSVARLVCPACGSMLVTSHEHAGDTRPGGLQEWSCTACGYSHARPLTCEECRP
jgi:formate dehydrogenase maturation protein FdhE